MCYNILKNMKKKGFDFVKRVIAVVIMAIVVLTSIVSGLEKEDILLQKVDELKNYEIIYGDENGNIGLENQITKAEAVVMVCRMADIEADLTQATNFIDVERSFWATGYINAAYKQGIINGCGDMTFRPTNNVTYEEAVTIILKALGYTIKADSMGGYPYGYIKTAIVMGLSKEFGVANEGITKADFVKLIYTALDIPVIKQVSYGEYEEYAIMDGGEYPLETMRIKKREGI